MASWNFCFSSDNWQLFWRSDWWVRMRGLLWQEGKSEQLDFLKVPECQLFRYMCFTDRNVLVNFRIFLLTSLVGWGRSLLCLLSRLVIFWALPNSCKRTVQVTWKNLVRIFRVCVMGPKMPNEAFETVMPWHDHGQQLVSTIRSNV